MARMYVTPPVVLFMTCKTLGRSRAVGSLLCSLVTIRAIREEVHAGQGQPSPPMQIEGTGIRPPDRCVAIGAISPEPAGVLVFVTRAAVPNSRLPG